MNLVADDSSPTKNGEDLHVIDIPYDLMTFSLPETHDESPHPLFLQFWAEAVGGNPVLSESENVSQAQENLRASSSGQHLEQGACDSTGSPRSSSCQRTVWRHTLCAADPKSDLGTTILPIRRQSVRPMDGVREVCSEAHVLAKTDLCGEVHSDPESGRCTSGSPGSDRGRDRVQPCGSHPLDPQVRGGPQGQTAATKGQGQQQQQCNGCVAGPCRPDRDSSGGAGSDRGRALCGGTEGICSRTHASECPVEEEERQGISVGAFNPLEEAACDQLCDLASELEVTPKVLSQRQGAQLREFADTMNAELENLADIFSHLEDQAEDRDVLWEIACGHLPQLATEGERLAPCTTNPVNYTSEWF